MLVEAGFIDSDKDNAIFSNQLQQVAQAIADAFEETIGATQTVTDSVVPNHSQLKNEQTQGNYGVLIMGFTSMEEAQQLIRDMEMSGHETMIVQ